MEPSHFIRLSSEIRNEIWHHVFTSPYALKLQNHTLQHPLTRTCRQMRGESLAMFYSLTRFNAHLETGPTTPLLRWLRKLDPEILFIINEVNIWDLHNLNGKFHGTETAQALLLRGPQDTSKKYTLQPVSGWVFAQHGFSKVLKEVILALHSIGLGLLRFCVVNSNWNENDGVGVGGYDEDTQASLISPTSSFALVRLDSRPAGQIFVDRTTNIEWLAQSCELSEPARAELIRGLTDNEMTVEVLDRMRIVTFDFTSLELGGRIVDVRSVEGSDSTRTDHCESLTKG